MSKIKTIIGSLAGILVTANSVLAEGSTNVSTNVTSNLGPFSGIATEVLNYAKWIGIAMALFSLLFLWIGSNAARMSTNPNVQKVVHFRDHMQGWFKDNILAIIGLIALFSILIPLLNSVM